MAAELPVPAADPAAVREAIREILARPEYAEAGPSLLERAWQWVAELLGRLLQALAGTGRASLLGTAVLLAAVVVVAVLLARFGRGLRRDPGAPLRRGGRLPTAAEWRSQAERHAQAGRWRDAVRSSYRGLIAELAGMGLVEEIPGRTSGEYLALVRQRVPAAADPFAAATRLFDRAWYGRAPVGDEQLGAFDEAARAVLAATRQRATSPA